MEIGSAYALQVCLLQIPAMVAFSAWYDPAQMGKVADTFTYVICPLQSGNPFSLYTRLIFPRWDVIVIILSIFLLTYTYIEAKANYHRGSILVLRYVSWSPSGIIRAGDANAIALFTQLSRAYRRILLRSISFKQ
jgi:Ca2+:H+ antiporter